MLWLAIAAQSVAIAALGVAVAVHILEHILPEDHWLNRPIHIKVEITK